MSSGTDDDALRWDGDEDVAAPPAASRHAPVVPERPADPAEDARVDAPDVASVPSEEPPALPDGFHAVGKGADSVGHLNADGTVTLPGEKKPLSSASLVAVGVLAGVYLLLIVGWVIGGLRLQTVSFLVSDAAFVPFFWLAILAPGLWFVTTWLIARHSATWAKLAWLIAGVVLLLPWPFILVGAVGIV